jgi:hypothetical protein
MLGPRRASVIGLAVTMASLVGAVSASAAQLIADLHLTSQVPGTPSGAVLKLIRPDGPDGKPKPEAVGVFELPDGTIINEAAVPACTKDDATWQLEGESACPDSHIGEGFATAITGFGPPVDPLTIDLHWYHAPGQIVALYTAHETTAPVLKVARVHIKGATFVAPLDLPPGYPPGTKTVPKESYVALDRLVSEKGAFITTPSTCPPSGQWVSRVTLTYDDGTTDSATSTAPCQRTGHGGRPEH